MAELWMGAHPKLPSMMVKSDGETIPLNDYITSDPVRILGEETERQFSGRFPFLFKVLAAGNPLSIQVHPSLAQAKEGFARENAAGISLDAFTRNYKDDNHKPEIIYALSDFTAMRGFREPSEIATIFRKLGFEETAPVSDPLYDCPPDDLKIKLTEFFTALMNLSSISKEEILEMAVDAAFGKWSERGYGMETEAYWIRRFAKLYPGDIGILSPLYLNIVELKPGQAMYLPAGELHAYLEGLGIELMANSDNVLRGGLTPKNIDVPELLSTLEFTAGRPEVLQVEELTGCETGFSTPAPEFFLSKIDLHGAYNLADDESAGLPSIMLCVSGSVSMTDESGSVLEISRGESVFTEYGSRLKLEGTGVLFRASVPGK
jgi:mannose-6-phosphate isomerase